MAIAFVIFVSDLVAEFLAHTFIILCALKAARAIASCALESFLHGFNHCGVFVKSYLHYLLSSIFFASVAFGT